MIVAEGNINTEDRVGQEHGLSLSVMTRSEEFDAIGPAWSRLFEECDVSVYQSFEWQRLWWKYFGEGKAQLHLLTLRRGQRVVGIAPFLIETTRTLGLFPLRRLAFIGQGPSDYLDVLFVKGEEEACAQLVAEHLTKHQTLFDIIHLEDFTERLPNHSLLYDALKNKGLTGDHYINEYCPRTQLQEDWEKTLASFKVDTRREIRRRARNIHKNFTVEYEIVPVDQTAAGIDEFIELHQHKWTSIGHAGEFADARRVQFHHELAHAFARKGWLYLAFLRVNGERVASLYCFMFRQDLAVYLTGNSKRSDVYRFSPGRVLTAYCMEQAVAQGRTVCDFMRGNEPYKYELDAKDVPNWAMLLYNPHSLRPELRYRITLLMKSLKRRTMHERLLYQIVAREHGVFSPEMRDHIKGRLKKNLVDGAAKAKAPERATHIHVHATGKNDESGNIENTFGGKQ